MGQEGTPPTPLQCRQLQAKLFQGFATEGLVLRFEEESVRSVCCPWRFSPPGWRRESRHCGWTGHRSLNGSYPDLDIRCCHRPTLLEEPGANVFSLFTPLHPIHQQFLGPSPPDALKPPRCLHLLLPSLFRLRSPGPNHSDPVNFDLVPCGLSSTQQSELFL